MAKKEHIVRYTAEELAEKSRRGETRTDWARAAAMTYEEIEAQVAADPDEAGMVYDWDNATTVMPKPKVDLHMRVDGDVLDWFRWFERKCGCRKSYIFTVGRKPC